MAYEYSGQGSRLDFANPYYAENWLLASASVIVLAGALILLVTSRQAIATHHGLASWLPFFIGVGLLIFGLVLGKGLFAQLRYFFGRGQPAGLVRELGQDDVGQGNGSELLKQMLRDNALKFDEPKGPLNGLLYAWIRGLIFSPPALQRSAQIQFQTAIAVVVILLSFIVAWTGVSDPKTAAWLGLCYFAISIAPLLKRLDTDRSSSVSLLGLVLFILVAIFAPVVLPQFAAKLPDITWLSLDFQVLVLLVVSLCAVGLYFLALMAQMNEPPRTNRGCETAALSMNCHPKQLLDELDRNLQDAWVELIPNRRYARVLPKADGEAGSFSAELIEETQPMPAERERIGLATAFSLPRFRWIALLEVLGVLMALFGVICLAVFGAKFDPQHIDRDLISLLTLGIALLVLCRYCFNVGNRLWARIDFTSRLTWVEMEGTFQATEFNFGNDLTSQLKTSKRVINIETMTLRVWAAELDTVIFDKRHGGKSPSQRKQGSPDLDTEIIGKHGERSIIGLRGAPDYARQMVGHLTDFAHSQSIIVAPTAGVDLKKAEVLAAMSQQAAQAVPIVPNLLQAARPMAPANLPVHQHVAHCTQCGGTVGASDRFCGNCGAPVAA